MLRTMCIIFICVWIVVFMLCALKGAVVGGLLCVAGILANMWALRRFGGSSGTPRG